jgi:hypothetical protein
MSDGIAPLQQRFESIWFWEFKRLHYHIGWEANAIATYPDAAHERGEIPARQNCVPIPKRQAPSEC